MKEKRLIEKLYEIGCDLPTHDEAFTERLLKKVNYDDNKYIMICYNIMIPIFKYNVLMSNQNYFHQEFQLRELLSFKPGSEVKNLKN